jgi:hypothetical protein
MEEQERQQAEVQLEPELLYHYTTQSGLLGILKDNCIWATHTHYLNDSSELKILAESITKILDPCGETTAAQDECRISFEAIKNSIEDFQKRGVYVASFSAGEEVDSKEPFEGDSLAMWRAYSDDSGRYSIGFDRKQLESLVKSQNCLQDKADGFLLKCFYLYPNDAYICELAKNLLSFLHLTQKDSNNISGAGIVARIKHKGFEMEKEWRIIFVDKGDALSLSRDDILSVEVKFRQGKSQIVPYIPIRWKKENVSKLIRRIVVGPTPNKEDAEKSVEMLLKKYDIPVMGVYGREDISFISNFHRDKVEVVSSKIPYRNW